MATFDPMVQVQSIISTFQKFYPQLARGKISVWEMAQIAAICSFIPGFWYLRRRRDGSEPSWPSTNSLEDGEKSVDVSEVEDVDPGLLKKHSEFKSYTTSRFTYPSLRIFFCRHPQADKLPMTPAPLPLLVFIHGLGGSVAQFHPLLTSLSNLASCLSIDLPGCGLSAFKQKSWDAYTTGALAELLGIIIEEYREKEAGQKVVLIGHSMGCSLSALLASTTSPHRSAVSQHIVGLVAVCPRADPPSQDQVATFRKLLWIPTPIFDVWRNWDRRGGINSASVRRFVGDADEETKRLQERFNSQSRTPVWRRMVAGSLPKYVKGIAKGGLPGQEIWAGLEIPVFLVAGESDNITKPTEIGKIASYMGKSLPVGLGLNEDSVPIVDTTAPVNTLSDNPQPGPSEQDSEGLDNKSFFEVTPNTTEEAYEDPSTPNEELSTVPNQPSVPQKALKTTILPPPASHALLYMPSTVRTLAGLISDFLCSQVSPRLSLGWQLQFLSTAGKWDVKNLAKWQAVVPVSEPIAGIFRAMKTLREVDESHCPEIFVKQWGSEIKHVVDISHENPVYDPRGLENGGVRYTKFPTISKIPPTGDEVTSFVALIDRLREEQISRATEENWGGTCYIGVHCHYALKSKIYMPTQIFPDPPQPYNLAMATGAIVENNRKARDEVTENETTGGGELKIGEERNSQGDGDTATKSRLGTKREEDLAKPKPSKIKAVWGKLGLDMGTVMMMFKGSVAPTIAIAFYQANAVAKTFSTLGYLIPIICVISIPIMPRARYIQTLLLNILAICIASSVSLLAIWSGVQARLHTTPAGSKAAYNSSQAAVCAIWLFANIWFVNVLRAKIPALQFPVMMYSIFSNVSLTYGPIFPNMATGISLVKELLEGFLTAFAISTGVSLFIIPINSRTVVSREQTGYIRLVRSTLKAQTAYLQSFESSDMFSFNFGLDNGSGDGSSKTEKKEGKSKSSSAQTSEAAVLKASVSALTALHGKLYGDLPFAKRESAFGKLCAADIEHIFELFRRILIPLVGMSTITDIFERIAERRGWIKSENSSHNIAEAWEKCSESQKLAEKQVWKEVMKTLHEPFAIAAAAMDEGLEHAGLVLELLPNAEKKKGNDEEAKGSEPRPGDKDFAKYLERKMAEFYGKRGATVKAWAREKGLSEDQFNSTNLPENPEDITPDEAQHRRDQQQLYLILFIEHLLFSTGQAITELIRFADAKVEDGTMKKKRIILPGQRRLKKWILSIGREDSSIDNGTPDSMEAGTNNVYMGSGFSPKHDPEHLPPRTAWQHFGNGIRTIPRFLGSPESAFGFRVASATLSIGIVAFLKDSQAFFIQQRLVWAMIIIAIGMNMTSGQSMFGFFGRIAGTALSMVNSIIIWYIVDQKTAGVIVMLWFFIFLEMYLFLKFPKFLPVWLITIVTQVLIIGYELQVHKIGIAAASSTGQPYYPIYELAPYRLACVAGGSFVAFIWTIFPYPISDRGWLRKDIGSTLYLLANYYSVVHSTIRTRLHGTEGDMESKNSPGRRLQKVRRRIFEKLILLLPSLRQHADWQKWEPTIGGKFPRDSYEGIILRSTNIMRYLSLMAYATDSWSDNDESAYPNTQPGRRRAWLVDLTKLIDNVGGTSHQITSILSLLSASVKQGVALPPYLELPKPYNLSRRLEALDRGILDSKNVEEPGYSSYAVAQVASSLVIDDLARLVEHVKDLVGGFHSSLHHYTSAPIPPLLGTATLLGAASDYPSPLLPPMKRSVGNRSSHF
ncbi:hypothetical protein B7494_g7055 [Chlorociboria aeruginascens]|nr:hypothetical protein B7494_g7055 [Chlorociboria aeruginascens]